MFVMTVDQRGSRRDVDRVAPLLDDLRDLPALRPPQRTAGDEVQLVTDDAGLALSVALDLIDRQHWSIGIGAGDVEHPLPEETRAGRGRAFEAARRAVDRAKNAPGRIAFSGPDSDSAEDADAALALLSVVVAGRTPEGREAVSHLRRGLTQTETAELLGISKQAVSQRLSVAHWQVEKVGRRLAERLLAEADT
ncbi:hypothetical protein G4H71_21280 [Rhodococcus triatomae]|uniref:HTH cro/C1-type domain-containing protein n=1 Tax=Rhodococcus triatomae TaxID=300028 RepID=A0A1G8K824_9NOCA|nr:hypothetical protein [Rhodococcus triatomae]QNG18847.1 hypothetical protein G4H72_09095 [Rhodococcus triatomae]QNG25240.1 hypothetical protein G4H71_21280 [Rhodococcus triatomae]SDI39574.1 hypothetical protein SAMN05444695_10751 [Rhodococcus triatomae]